MNFKIMNANPQFKTSKGIKMLEILFNPVGIKKENRNQTLYWQFRLRTGGNARFSKTAANAIYVDVITSYLW